MNILRFLICNSRMSGKQLMLARHYTTWDDFHQCYSYICADKAEYDKMCREVVGKQQKRFWGEVEVFNTETKKRSKVTEVIGVILAVEQAQPASPPAERTFHYTLSQTPGDSQSGGEQSPAESKGTLSEPEQAPVIDIAADLAANTAPADDVEAGQEQPQAVSEELPPEDAPPASTPPAKRKAGRPAKAK